MKSSKQKIKELGEILEASEKNFAQILLCEGWQIISSCPFV